MLESFKRPGGSLLRPKQLQPEILFLEWIRVILIAKWVPAWVHYFVVRIRSLATFVKLASILLHFHYKQSNEILRKREFSSVRLKSRSRFLKGPPKIFRGDLCSDHQTRFQKRDFWSWRVSSDIPWRLMRYS